MLQRDLLESLENVVAVTVTPFHEDGSLDLEAHTRLVERLIESGVRAITVNGNTSEFYSLTAEEMTRIVTCAARAAGQRAVVIAGVGLDTTTAVEQARAAERAGADAVMVHQPVHPYRSQEGWILYHEAICQAVPELGVLLYVRDPHVESSTVIKLADRCSNLVGIKYAVPDPVRLTRMLRGEGAGRLVWLCGLAELWAPFFATAGARGFTSGLVMVAPQLSLAMQRQLQEDDVVGAMRTWQMLQPFEELRARARSANNVPVVKEALAQLGIVGRTVRPPLSLLEEGDRREVAAILEAWRAQGTRLG
jgi:4-hydroxy-tetrahydrodipicolinate synthase